MALRVANGRSSLGVLVAWGLAVAIAGCSAPGNEKSSPAFSRDSGVGDDSGGIVPGDDAGLTTDGGFNVPDTPAGETGGTSCFGADPDCDEDGYPKSKDCNDLERTINPDAYDFEGDGIDNDCDGTIDNPVKTCDPTPGSTTPLDFARAADLCPQRSISVKTGKPYDPIAKVEFGSIGSGFFASATSMANTKIVPKFGDNMPRMGATLFGMQSGPLLGNDPRGATGGLAVPNACASIGLHADDCKSLTAGTDTGGALGLSAGDYQEVRMFIRVPSNAKAMSFDFAFFSSEFNQYWKSEFNDAFFALVTSKKVASRNVARDATGNAITVNSGFFQLCPTAPGPAGLDGSKVAGLANCVGVDGDPSKSILGTLKGTNFDGAGIGRTDDTTADGKWIYGGGSGWLTTKFEVEPGESMVVRFIMHDTGDSALDSAVIVDNIRWDQAPPDPTAPPTDRPK